MAKIRCYKCNTELPLEEEAYNRFKESREHEGANVALPYCGQCITSVMQELHETLQNWPDIPQVTRDTTHRELAQHVIDITQFLLSLPRGFTVEQCHPYIDFLHIATEFMHLDLLEIEGDTAYECLFETPEYLAADMEDKAAKAKRELLDP